MKHLFTFLLVAISAASFAQGNLQFNQVINVSVYSYIKHYNTVTVPVGKVLKLHQLLDSQTEAVSKMFVWIITLLSQWGG